MRILTTLLLLIAFNLSAQINVNLVRQSDGVTIGTAILDEQFCGQVDTITTDTTSSGAALYFDGNASQSISCDYSFNGAFDVSFTTQGVTDVGGWIGLIGFNSANRFLLSNSNQRFWGNFGSGSLSKRNNLVFDSALLNTVRIYRDSLNNVFIQFNGETPFSCFSASNTITIGNIAKAYDKYFKGYLLKYEINGETWNLNEGEGSVLTGSNGTIHTLQSNISFMDMWQSAPSQTASIQVYNEGIGGNNVNNLLARTSDISQHDPDQVFVWVGTNDALNAPSKILNVNVYEDSLNSLIVKLLIENPNTTITLINVIPCNDSILKTTHNFAPYYGADSTFNLNTDIIPTFNSAIEAIAAAHGLTVLNANTEIQNNINVITDGTHISATGYGLIALLCETVCFGKKVIVCFGDSLTAGLNAGGGFDYPTQLEQILNN